MFARRYFPLQVRAMRFSSLVAITTEESVRTFSLFENYLFELIDQFILLFFSQITKTEEIESKLCPNNQVLRKIELYQRHQRQATNIIDDAEQQTPSTTMTINNNNITQRRPRLGRWKKGNRRNIILDTKDSSTKTIIHIS